MSTHPVNQSTPDNPVGRFMVAVGAIIEHAETNNILIVQRSQKLDWHPGEWEIDYGRIDQFEDPDAGLRREVFEEVGILDLSIGPILRIWHIYRGEKAAENDLIGITYLCRTTQQEIRLSDEHAAYAWVTPEDALARISVEGIREDILRYLEYRQSGAIG